MSDQTDAPEVATHEGLGTDTITGKSGTLYSPVDVFNEMTGDHEEYVTDLIAPVIPALTSLMESAANEQTTADAGMVMNLASIASSLVENRIHRRLIAAVYLPVDGDREFNPDAVDERMKDLGHLTIADAARILVAFFNGASSSFKSTFSGSLGTIVTNGRSALNQTTSDGTQKKKRLR